MIIHGALFIYMLYDTILTIRIVSLCNFNKLKICAYEWYNGICNVSACAAPDSNCGICGDQSEKRR